MSAKPRETRKIATYSLIIMAVGFIVTIPFQESFWLRLLHGGFEAGLVGGLADWFAVTALFRYPLGLRIPHTALLPNNRDRMVDGLISMLRNDWLTKESILAKVKQVQFTEKLSSAFKKKLGTNHFQNVLIKLMTQIILSIDVEKLTPFVKKQLVATLSAFEMKKVFQLLSTKLISEQFDKKALDYLLGRAEEWLSKEQNSLKLGTVLMNVLRKVEVEGIMQFALRSIQSLLNEEKLGSLAKNLLLSVVANLKNEWDPNRKALIEYIQNEIHGMNENHELLEAAENWKSQFLAKWEPDQAITESLQKMQNYIVELLGQEEAYETYIAPLLNHLLVKIEEKDTEIDRWIQNQIAVFVENNHALIGNLVRENLDKLDNDTLVHMVETNVGKDLQWIRVNGAVCGFIIGIILTIIQTLYVL